MIDPWVARCAMGLILGLVAGSFLGALVTRWPHGRSLVRGRSQCDGCDRCLSPLELIPVLSAILLRLRCRTCGARIDPVHLWLELACCAIGGLAFALAPGPVAAMGWSLLGWILLALAVLDARHFWLPDALTLPLAFLGLTIGPFTTAVPLPDRWIGAAAGYAGLMLIALGYRVARRKEGLGWGDAKLLGAIGAWTGWQALPLVLLCASGGALVWVALCAVVGGAVRHDTRVPLGTWLCVAVPVSLLLRVWQGWG